MFKSFDKDGSISYEKLGLKEKLESFIKKRLEHFCYKDYSFINDISEIKPNDHEYSCVINVVNPFIDSELIMEIVSVLKQSPEYDSVKCVGAVPGTEPDIIFRTNALTDKGFDKLNSLTYNSDTQSKYNNQFNLRKLKRVKMFLKITDLIENIETLTIPELIDKLHDDKIFEKMISFFEDVKLIYLDKCPCCGSKIRPLFPNVSQPLTGYLPYDKPLIYRCVKCKLIVTSPYAHPDDAVKLYDFYYLELQGTDYLVGRKARYKHYDVAVSMVEKHIPKDAECLELGSGYGAFLYYLKENKPSWRSKGCDLKEVIDFHKFNERKEVEVLNINFLKDDLGTDKYVLISCWEVIEHIPFSHFNEFLDRIYKALKPGGIFMFSTPDFDSPLCQIFDFYATVPTWHPLVFSTSWMHYFFDNHKQFKILKIENESTQLETYETWYNYYKSTSKHFESNAAANLLLEIWRDSDANKAVRNLIKKKGWGMEMVTALQKK